MSGKNRNSVDDMILNEKRRLISYSKARNSDGATDKACRGKLPTGKAKPTLRGEFRIMFN